MPDVLNNKSIPQEKKMKIAIVSGYDKPQPRFYSHINHKSYADKHGYDYYFCTEDVPHKSFFSKIDKILMYIDNYDYIFWIDDDAFFMNHDILLEGLINEGKNKELIFCRSPINPEGQFTLLSSGNFFIKNTNKTKSFLKDIFTVDMGYVQKIWKKEYGLFCWGDQEVIIYLLHHDKKYSDTEFFEILHYKYFNSRPFNFEKSFDECFLCHFPGEKKETQICKFMSKFNLNEALMSGDKLH